MAALRSPDALAPRDLLDALRPRFLTLTLRTDGLNLRWAMPLWAIEETLRLLVGLAPLVPLLARYAPEGVQRRLGPLGAAPKTDTAGALLATLAELFDDRSPELLRLPPGEPFVRIETDDLFLEIGQR